MIEPRNNSPFVAPPIVGRYIANPCWVAREKFRDQLFIIARPYFLRSSSWSRQGGEKKWFSKTKIEHLTFLRLEWVSFTKWYRRRRQQAIRLHQVSEFVCDKTTWSWWSSKVFLRKYKLTTSMVSSAQNGDHRNGHVLVPNQPTRLEPDNEATASKSKIIAKLICLRRQAGHKRKSRTTTWAMETHATSRVDVHAEKELFLNIFTGEFLSRSSCKISLTLLAAIIVIEC